jgi:hypothetical protein
MRGIPASHPERTHPMSVPTTTKIAEPTVEDDVEATLRDVRALLDDPVALLERALEMIRLPRVPSFVGAASGTRGAGGIEP